MVPYPREDQVGRHVIPTDLNKVVYKTHPQYPTHPLEYYTQDREDTKGWISSCPSQIQHYCKDLHSQTNVHTDVHDTERGKIIKYIHSVGQKVIACIISNTRIGLCYPIDIGSIHEEVACLPCAGPNSIANYWDGYWVVIVIQRDQGIPTTIHGCHGDKQELLEENGY